MRDVPTALTPDDVAAQFHDWSPVLSHSGRWLAGFDPVLVDDQATLTIRCTDSFKVVKRIGLATSSGGWLEWSYSDRFLLLVPYRPDEVPHVHIVDLDTGDVTRLTPRQCVASTPIGLAPESPMQALIACYRPRGLADVYKVDFLTKTTTIRLLNPGFVGWSDDGIASPPDTCGVPEV